MSSPIAPPTSRPSGRRTRRGLRSGLAAIAGFACLAALTVVVAPPASAGAARGRILYTSGSWSSQIFAVDADGSDQRNITRTLSGELDAVFAPDGNHIAVSAVPAGQWSREIVLVSLASPRIRSQLTNGPVSHRAPEFSSDGQWMTTTSESPSADIWVMAADGSNPVNLTNSGTFDRHASWG